MALTDDILAYWNLNDDGSGNVSLVDSTGNGNSLVATANDVSPNISLGRGIIEGDAIFSDGDSYLANQSRSLTVYPNGSFSFFAWIKPTQFGGDSNGVNFIFFGDNTVGQELSLNADGYLKTQVYDSANFTSATSANPLALNEWQYVGCTRDSNTNTISVWVNGEAVGSNTYTSNGTWNYDVFNLGRAQSGDGAGQNNFYGEIDEVGVWGRALSPTEVNDLWNSGSGITYPFPQTPTSILYYNNAQNDGDWGNILNWWQDSGFTVQATALPTNTNPINLYGAVTKNTQGSGQCFCSSANFWSANFGVGLTLQATGTVNIQGTSIFAGTTTDGVSMHDSSQLTSTSVIDGNVTMRDSSRAFGSILGNATVYYDGGNGQFPIGGTVAGSVSYLGWPAVTPQWFNDKVSGGANDGDFSNLANWWTDNNYNVRPINAEGTQELPDASTDVFIAPSVGIVANTGTSNPTINSVTANNSNIQNISITATNGFLFSGNQGVANAVLYGNVVFQDTAYNDHAVIQGKATYKSAASLQYSWGQNSLGNVNAGMYNGSTSFEVDIAGGGGGNGGFISRLLNLPWFINI